MKADQKTRPPEFPKTAKITLDFERFTSEWFRLSYTYSIDGTGSHPNTLRIDPMANPTYIGIHCHWKTEDI